MERVERELESLYTDLEEKVNKIAEREFVNVVLPFLKRRGWQFIAGMGTWWIGPKDGDNRYSKDYPEDIEFGEIEKLLSVVIDGMNQELGSLMPDYGITHSYKHKDRAFDSRGRAFILDND